jgi:PPP family 3-phenylpropionic acid transporter
VVFLAAWPATGYWGLLLTTGVAFVLFGLAAPPVDALALTGVRRSGLDFGRMRMFGSASFIVTNVAAGALLGLLAPENIYWFILAGMVAGVTASFFLPVTPPDVRALDDASRTQGDTRHWRDVLGDVPFLSVLLAAGLVHGSCGLLYAFGSIAWHALGYSSLQIGAFWAFGIGAEVLVLFIARPYLKAVRPQTLLLAGAGATALRWALFPLASEAGFLGFAVLQSLHGLTFSATYLGVQKIITRHVPDGMTASAQGIFAMLVGLILALVTWIAGPIYTTFGLDGFYLMVPVCLLAFALYLGARRITQAS